MSDLRYVYNPLAETEMDTIVLVQVLRDGEWGPLRPNTFYRVATSSYLGAGGDGCGCLALPDCANLLFVLLIMIC